MKRQVISAVGALALLAFAGCDDYKYETYTADLSGAAEGVTTSGSGRATLLLSRDGTRADITVTASGLTDIVSGHIHRGGVGVNGPIIFTLWLPKDGPFDADHSVGKTWTTTTSSVSLGTDVATTGAQPLDAGNLADLRSGGLYVNIHTKARPSGEIRGQLVRQ